MPGRDKSPIWGWVDAKIQKTATIPTMAVFLFAEHEISYIWVYKATKKLLWNQFYELSKSKNQDSASFPQQILAKIG